MDVVRALGRHVRDKTTDMGPGTMLVPPDFYRDPLRDAAERSEIFLKLPMLVGMTQDIANPGDILLFDDYGPSIMIIRRKDGTLGAFMNMCMHRGARLVQECGHHARLRCPFHGWTFNLDGRLIGVPRKDAFDKAELDKRNLVPVPVGEWQGLIFVKLHPGEEQIDVKAWLGDFAPFIEMFDLANSHRIDSGRLDYASNWKFALDTYCEGYHIGFLHQQTVGASYYGDLIKYDSYGLHHRIAFAPNSYRDTLGKAEAEMPAIPYSPTYYIFPNIALNIQPMDHGGSFISLHRLYPGATVADGFSILSTYKLGGAPTDEDRQSYRDAHQLIMKVVGTEDYAVCGPAYRNLAHAPQDFRAMLGRNELGAQNVHRHLAQAAGMPLDH
jgi:phenylpropionate dioxygenase-like ring-hydroxylating dioxygenase large terminal subunit